MTLDSSIKIGGFRVVKTTAQMLSDILLAKLQLHTQTMLFFANTNFVVQCRDMRDRMAEQNAIIVNDGVGMDVVSVLMHGDRFKENLNGTDFIPFLFRQSGRPLRLFMVGGKQDVLLKAADYASRQLGQEVVGICDGYEGVKNDSQLVDAINMAKAEVVLVALGNPIQEKWILDHRQVLCADILVGVGALFDFWSGNKPRAPSFVQKMRLEWLYRLCLEPRRLARRYTVDIFKFLFHCCKAR